MSTEGKTSKEGLAKQIEYYFSDANITRDVFLQKTMKDNGGCPISVLNKFNRMKQYNATEEEIEEVVEEIDSLEVVDKKIRRKEPIPSKYDASAKTLIVKNIPTTYTLEQIEAVFAQHADKIARIAMRRDEKKAFKGSAFVELKSADDVAAFKALGIKVPAVHKSEEENTKAEEGAETESVKRAKVEENELVIMESSAYFKTAKKEEKKKEAAQKIVECFKNKIYKYRITAKSSNKAEGTEECSTDIDPACVKISDIKAQIQKVAFVDIPAQHIRMKEETAEIAPIVVGEWTLTFSKLDEREVEEYCHGLTLDKKGRIAKPRK